MKNDPLASPLKQLPRPDVLSQINPESTNIPDSDSELTESPPKDPSLSPMNENEENYDYSGMDMLQRAALELATAKKTGADSFDVDLEDSDEYVSGIGTPVTKGNMSGRRISTKSSRSHSRSSIDVKLNDLYYFNSY